MRKGNQVWILSDPVTVFREYPLIESIVLLQYEKEKGIWWSVSQETCLVFEERLPMKVQFLTERYLRYAFLGCLLLEAGIFCLWNALDVEPYRQPGWYESWTYILILVWQVVTAFGLLRRKDKCTSPKSLKKRYPVTQQFAYIINQPKYSIRQLRHLRQCCSDFSISSYWDYLQLPGRANERGLDVLIADVFCTFFNTWSCMESRIWKYLAIWLYLFEKQGFGV